MNNRGQLNVGVLIVLAVMIIVSAVLLQPITSSQAQMTNTYQFNNVTTTLGNAGTVVYLGQQIMIGNPVITNATGSYVLVNNNNFTISQAINPTTGTPRITIVPVAISSYNSSTVNISYVAGLDGYAQDAASRTVAGLIGLFAALALLAAVIYYVWKEGGLEFLGI